MINLLRATCFRLEDAYTLDDIPFRKRARPTGKLAEVVAAKIEREIIELGWPVGHLIGSEADLIRRFAVSRAVIREAIRLLEADMMARMKPGPNGGLLVIAPDTESVAHTMALFLTYRRVSVRQLLDMRSQVEGHAAALAATNGSEEDRTKLRELLADEVSCVEHDWQSAKNFHVLIAQMSGNPASFLIAQSLIMLTEQQTVPTRTRRTAAAHVHRVHEKIGNVILERDAERARELMMRHILALDPWLGEAHQPRGTRP
jgi:DNA-binding FadR family transcriptional regulator